HAALAEWNDDRVAGLMVARRRPVLPAFRSRTRGQQLIDVLVDDFLAIGGLAGLGIDLDEDVLENCLARLEILGVDAIELPQDARLADGHHRLPVAVIDQDALEHLIEVKAFAWCVAEIP